MARPRIIAGKHPEPHNEEAWGLYLVDEARWLSVTFVTERDAKRFCEDLEGARRPFWP
ncbi:hypothetical protein EV292_11472 [Sphingomonas sp. BK235]|nr:hypothetical protein EV292_11472 [Sphingomonas sp. BK235]